VLLGGVTDRALREEKGKKWSEGSEERTDAPLQQNWHLFGKVCLSEPSSHLNNRDVEAPERVRAA
jgi:hypothetical protein